MKNFLIFIAVLFCAASTKGANPAFQDFNTNQHATTGNKVSIRNGTMLTNVSEFDRFSLTRAHIYQTNLSVPTAPTAQTNSAVGAGNIPLGNYVWAVTFVTTNGETSIGASGPAVALILDDQSATVTNIPVGAPGMGVIARKVYRSDDGGSLVYFLTNIPNNTTTFFVDNTPNSALGASPPADNTTGGEVYQDGVRNFFQDYISGNIFIGGNAGISNIAGLNNQGGGINSLMSLTNGVNNVAYGNNTLKWLRGGNANLALSGGALQYLQTGDYNTAGGQDSLGSLTNGNRNNGWGRDSLFKLLMGDDNTAFGDFSLENLLNGSNNVALGSHVDIPATNSGSIGIGNYAKITGPRQFVFGSTNAGLSPTGYQMAGMLGSGTDVGITADGWLYRTTSSGGGGTNAVSPPISSVQYNSNGVQSGSSGFVFTNEMVGIGTAAPGEKLDVAGVVQSTDGFQVVNANAQIALSGGDLAISTFAGKDILLLPNGNVGIGTNAPTETLEIFGSAKLTGGSNFEMLWADPADGFSGQQLYLSGGPSLIINSNSSSAGSAGSIYVQGGMVFVESSSLSSTSYLAHYSVGSLVDNSAFYIHQGNDLTGPDLTWRFDTDRSFGPFGSTTQDLASATYPIDQAYMQNINVIGGSGFFATIAANSTGGLLLVNTNQLVVNTTNGNVGIGTTTPDALLGLGASTGSKINLYDGAVYDLGIQTDTMQFIIPGSGQTFAFGTGTSGSFSEVARIQGNGTVGIGTATPGQTLHVSGNTHLDGGQFVKIWTTNASYTISTNFHIFEWSEVAVAGTITLPAATTCSNWFGVIKDIGGNALATNITIAPVSGTIDGAASVLLQGNYAAKTIYSSGSRGWFVR